MKLSILTATYNRGEDLKKLYKSIEDNLNSNLEIEWVVVDDGSVDNTKKIIEKFINEKKFEIKYYFEKNKGKMNAINIAKNIATGDLIIDCDSDDIFTKNSFAIIAKNANKLFEDKELYGLVFLKKEEDGTISGNKFKKNHKKTTMFDLYFKENVAGEKILVYNSIIRKKYLHNIENNEKFITEARMYHKMDEKYKILTINEAVEQGSYKKDGYTKNIQKIFLENPKGYYMYFKELLEKDMKGVLFKKRIYVIKHYILFSYLSKNKFDNKFIKDKLNKILYTILYIPGMIKSKKYK